MVEPEKKKGNSMEQRKMSDPPLRSKRKAKRLRNLFGRASLTSITSATSLTRESAEESLKVMSDKVLTRGRHSTISLPTTTLSVITLTGPSSADSEKPVPVEDEPEIEMSRSSISLKTIKTPSRTSIASARSAELKLEGADSYKDVQIIERNVVEKGSQTNVLTSKQPNETRTEPKTGKSAEIPGKRNNISWKSANKPELRQSAGSGRPPTPMLSAKRTSLQSAPQKNENVKTSIILEYSNIIETIKQQNNNLEKIKCDMLAISSPIVRKNLEKRYFAEENKLNDELVKAMVLQSRYPYERWPEIPVVPNIYDDYSGIHPQLLVKKARQDISSNEPPERKSAGEECPGGEISSDDSSPCPNDPNTVFKDLLDKVDKENQSDICCRNQSESINTIITHLLKKRKQHMQHCIQCEVEPKNCRVLETTDEELCRVCNIKLKQLLKNEEAGECDCDDSKSSRPTSSSDEEQSCVSKQDFDSLEDEQLSAIIKLTQLGNPEKQQSCSPCCKNRKEESRICSKKKVKPVSSREANKLLSVLEKMASELKQITSAQNTICNAADPCITQNVQTHADSPLPNVCTPTMVQCANAQPNAQPINGCNTSVNTISNSNASANIISETSTNSHSETEMVFEKHRLKEQLREVKAERDELKFIMREQENQMFDYRNRYLEAKQEIEEQLHHICELEKCNECIEDRINTEMKQIKAKFEQNLKHLKSSLECESKKLRQVCKEKEDIKEKLNICCSELHKERVRRSGAGDQNRTENIKLSDELQTVREMYKQLERVNTQQKEEIKCLKLELATLRRDTAAILCRSKERVQRQIGDFNKRVYELEDELAKERAHSCCAAKEKDRCCKLLESSRCENQAAKAQLKTLEAYVKSLCCQLELLKSKPC